MKKKILHPTQCTNKNKEQYPDAKLIKLKKKHIKFLCYYEKKKKGNTSDVAEFEGDVYKNGKTTSSWNVGAAFASQNSRSISSSLKHQEKKQSWCVPLKKW